MVGSVLGVTVIVILATIVAYYFKDDLGLENWNMDFLDDIVRAIKEATGEWTVRLVDNKPMATFYRSDDKKCTLGTSTNLALLQMPSTWYAIMLYNTGKVTLKGPAGDVVIEAQDIKGSALSTALDNAGITDANMAQDDDVQVIIEQEPDEKIGYIRIYQSFEGSTIYATLGASDFINVSVTNDLMHSECPVDYKCSIAPYTSHRDVGDVVADGELDKQIYNLGAFDYQWINGSSDVKRGIIGIEKYLTQTEMTEYAGEYSRDPDGARDYADLEIVPGATRGALLEETDDNKKVKFIYNSFKLDEVEAGTDAYPDGFHCMYGSKVDFGDSSTPDVLGTFNKTDGAGNQVFPGCYV